MATAIPDKAYFKIGEAAHVVGVPPYVLRYWETEFEALRPEKSSTNHRVYRRRDIDTLLEIKRLLYDERFTIAGARRFLRGASRRGEEDADRVRAADERLRRAAARAAEEARHLLALLDADERGAPDDG